MGKGAIAIIGAVVLIIVVGGWIYTDNQPDDVPPCIMSIAGINEKLSTAYSIEASWEVYFDPIVWDGKEREIVLEGAPLFEAYYANGGPYIGLFAPTAPLYPPTVITHDGSDMVWENPSKMIYRMVEGTPAVHDEKPEIVIYTAAIPEQWAQYFTDYAMEVYKTYDPKDYDWVVY